MSLPIGRKLGHYEIIAPIGAGGMGEVYRDQALLWGSDDALCVYQFGRIRTAIERVDLSTGERSEWKELKPADAAGVMSIQPVILSPNRESYAYSCRRFLSELYVVKGLL